MSSYIAAEPPDVNGPYEPFGHALDNDMHQFPDDGPGAGSARW